MARREYRELLEKDLEKVREGIIEEMDDFLENKLKDATRDYVDMLESEVNDMLASAEDIDLDDSEEMKSGIESIISDLKELADKLY